MPARIVNHVDRVRAKYDAATRKGIDKTMAEAVVYAKSNHPGWKNITTTAEGSVRIGEFAYRQGDHVVGKWGSVGGQLTREGKSVKNYVIFLELKHGSFLRNAADAIYPRLTSHIRGAAK